MALLCITAVASARGPESTYPVQIDSGWNLLSLPASVSNGSNEFLFPSAASAAFIFRYPAGYEEQDTLRNGIGFWLKFNSSETVSITGELIFKDTVEVHQGWNIVGSLSVPIAVDSIKTDPPGIIASQFLRFRRGAGYEEANTLYPGYGYWVKVNQGGLMILSSGSGRPCPGLPTVDYAGKTYTTVLIGSQCWLRENLDVGTMVLGSQEQADNDTIEKYCYGDDTVNCNTYGGLYQWNEAMQYDTTQGVQDICPPGWHIPTLAEFQTLSATVGGDGNALKAIGQGSDGGAGTNTSGFSALLGGYRLDSGYFYGLGSYADVWSSTQHYAPLAYSLYMSFNFGSINLYTNNENHSFSVRCLKDEAPNQPPAVPWNPYPDNGATNISTSPTLSWLCSDPDADPLTYDVYFGTVNPPDTLVSSNQMDTTLTRTGLAAGTTYYWKIVAKDEHAHSTAGPVWSFTTYTGGGSPCPGTPTVTYAGKTYNSVQIGNQCWLRENLDVGTMIPGSFSQTNNGTIEKYCYGNTPSNCGTYGGLYQWNEAMQYGATPGAQGICPPGWHIPTLSEFQVLSSTVGGDGNALKAIGQGSGAGAGTNASGLSMLLVGYRHGYGGFDDLGEDAYAWSSTESSASAAHHSDLYANDGYFYLVSNYKLFGFSVRCLKD